MSVVSRRLPLAVFLIAAAVRAVFVLDVRDEPLFSVLAVDARSYFELASWFASGDWLYGDQALWFAPLYPTWLGTLFRLFGPDVRIALAVQFLMGCGTAALAAVLAARVSAAAGWTAGLLLAFSPVAVFYEGQLLYTSLAVFFTALFLWRSVRGLETGTLRDALLAGLALGTLGLIRSNSLLFLPVAVLWFARRTGPRAALALAAGTLVMLAPVLLRNGLVAGAWTPLTVNGGMIFATGFNDDSVGGRALQRSPEDFGPNGAFHREAERALGRRLTLAEASGFHRDRAREWIRENPAATARLTLRKAGLLITSREIDDNLGFPLVRGQSAVLSALPVGWPWFVIPGLLGAAWAWRRRGGGSAGGEREMLWYLTAYSAVYSVSLLLFFVNARYRLPMAVPLAVLGGAGLHALLVAARNRAWRPLAVPAVIAVLGTVAAFRDPGVSADPALGLLAVGSALERGGHHGDALRVTDRALALRGDIPGAHQTRAVILTSLGRPAEALEAARTATRLDPDLAPAWMQQGALLARAGDFAPAVEAFRRAVELQPGAPAPLQNLAQALAAVERWEEAVVVGRRAKAAGASRIGPLLAEWEAQAASGAQR